MQKKTALRLDEQLLAGARDVLGTTTATETIHAALAEVVARRGRQRLFERLRSQEGMDLADESVMAQAWQ
ncbi:MAG: type II toxin-antitoxin system VapB family antitoxin [Acidimicrobiales bacterium]